MYLPSVTSGTVKTVKGTGKRTGSVRGRFSGDKESLHEFKDKYGRLCVVINCCPVLTQCRIMCHFSNIEKDTAFAEAGYQNIFGFMKEKHLVKL